MTISNQQFIHSAFSTGRDASGLVAYHGTSLQVLKEIVRTGVQASSSTDPTYTSQMYRLGDVFIYPIKDLAVVPFEMEMFDEDKAFEEASGYAEQIARYHGLAERLELDFGKARDEIFDSLLNQSNGRFDSDEIMYANTASLFQYLAERVTQKECSRRESIKLMNTVAGLQGVVLGYSQRVLDLGSPLPTNENGSEKEAVRVLNVDIGSIVCVEPLDQETYNYLASLEKIVLILR